MGSCGLNPYGSGYEPVAKSCEHDNKPSSSAKGGEFIEQLNDC